MDRSWIREDRLSEKYHKGVENFLLVAARSSNDHSFIRCPCSCCENIYMITLLDIKEHLFKNGFDPSYKIWIWHGENDISEESQCGDTPDSIDCDYDINMINDLEDTLEMARAVNEGCAEGGQMGRERFDKLLLDAVKPLYKDCKKYTKLATIVKLFNLKAKNGWSDKSFSKLLQLVADILPQDNELPSSHSSAKRSLSVFGIDYKKIHACPNDCVLYKNEYENAVTCPTCQTPRYKKMAEDGNEKKKGVPKKVMWYFPPVPRFQSWFQSMETSRELTWHANEREVDGKLRHPADSPAWKLVDEKRPEFASESRNLRLALSADGINPHSSMRTRYTCWPIILTTYNLPPWLCMKKKYIMLTMIISGPKQPGNDIDVYLAPLIEDLKALWEDGHMTYDAHRKEYFRLKAVLLWTINDFPAYGNLSGCVVKGFKGCPICGENTHSTRLKNSHKCVYMGHIRYLPKNHPFRNQRKAFNGERETEMCREPLSNEQVLAKVDSLKVTWGKKPKNDEKPPAKKRKRKTKKKDDTLIEEEDKDDAVEGAGVGVGSCWRKKSIFFELEYWKYLLVSYCIDVMHVERNVCESFVGTLLQILGKTKDGLAARQDLEELGLRPELAPQVKGKRTYLPPACYTLSKKEKRMFCQTLFDLKVPSGYSSNFKNCVSMEDLKLYGLKSHDCHMLMQQLLPVAIRGILPKNSENRSRLKSKSVVQNCAVNQNRVTSFNEGQICKLSIGVKTNIVAEGLVYDKSEPNEKIHNVILGAENVRVSVTKPIVPNAILPVPIHGEMEIVADATGSIVAWPKKFVITNLFQEQKENRDVGMYNINSKFRCSVIVSTFSGTLQSTTMKQIKIPVEKEMFGDNNSEIYVYKGDLIEFCSLEPISVTCIAAYMRFLYEKFQGARLRIQFFNPASFAFLTGLSMFNMISKRLQNAKEGQIYLLPWNMTDIKHWVLIVIHIDAMKIYWLDSLSMKPSPKLKLYFTSALSLLNRRGKMTPQPTWEFPKCPMQKGNVECGYFVMRFMRELIVDTSSPIEVKMRSFAQRQTYTIDEIDEIRSELIEFVVDYV